MFGIDTVMWRKEARIGTVTVNVTLTRWRLIAPHRMFGIDTVMWREEARIGVEEGSDWRFANKPCRRQALLTHDINITTVFQV
ncbi:hypothetical protein J6590_035878 [Homalodisca vitripennis]|nr:hypothetical protein J6590_035878 [Homalodisca vitripennis]